MKRFLITLTCVVFLIGCVSTAYAAEEPQVMILESVLDNGLTVVDEIVIYPQGRSTDKVAKRTKSIKDGDTVIAAVAFQATFRYDGSSVSVVSKSVTQKTTYDGWSYSQSSFTSSGGTVTLSFKLSKWLILNNSFTMSLSCDKNGNITYN